MLPSFDDEWVDGQRTKPRIQVLEIRHRDKLDGEPLAWLLVERQETYSRDPRDDSIYKASIRLSYERILPKHSHRGSGKGHFDGSYSKSFNSVSLTSSSAGRGAVFLDLPGLEGQRIGTYLFDEIVRWVQRWPDATVHSIELVSGQSHGENKARRNWFYEQFGIVFDYADPEHREGLSRPMQVNALTPVETWKTNIRERQVLDYVADVLYAEERASSELAQRERGIKYLVDERKRAEAKPVRWAFQRLWWRYMDRIMGSAVVFGLAALVWFRLRT